MSLSIYHFEVTFFWCHDTAVLLYQWHFSYIHHASLYIVLCNPVFMPIPLTDKCFPHSIKLYR